jgi:hypothetical protein
MPPPKPSPTIPPPPPASHTPAPKRAVVVGLLAVAATLALLASPAAAARTTQMSRGQPVAVRWAADVQPEHRTAAAIAVARANHWQAKGTEDGNVEATRDLSSGKHIATVDIVLGEDSFQVVYKDSHNFGYAKRACAQTSRKLEGARWRKPQTTCGHEVIHPTYNAWVEALQAALAQEFSILDAERGAALLAAQNPAPARTTASPTGIADELAKLDKLRDDGVLTDEEFETLKRRLIQP